MQFAPPAPAGGIACHNRVAAKSQESAIVNCPPMADPYSYEGTSSNRPRQWCSTWGNWCRRLRIFALRRHPRARRDSVPVSSAGTLSSLTRRSRQSGVCGRPAIPFASCVVRSEKNRRGRFRYAGVGLYAYKARPTTVAAIEALRLTTIAIAIAFEGAVVLRHITALWCVPHGLEVLQTGCLLPHAGAASGFKAVE